MKRGSGGSGLTIGKLLANGLLYSLVLGVVAGAWTLFVVALGATAVVGGYSLFMAS